MNYLIDTHILLWFLNDSPKLKKSTVRLISDTANTIYVSSATFWEINIKISLGKIKIDPEYALITQEEGIKILDIKLDHAMQLLKLAPIHKDPFDRIIVCQAIIENMRLITNDRQMKKYPVEVIQN